MGDSGFTVEGADAVYEGPIFRLERRSIRTPDDELVTRDVITHPGAVAAVVVHDGHLVLVEQYRAALDANFLEIPAGKLDVDGEELEAAARRELIEEVGLDPRSLQRLGEFIPAAGFCDELITIFASTDCVEVERAVDGVEEAYSTIVHVPLGDIDDLLTSGRMRDSKSLIGLFWARDRGLFD